RRLHFGAVSGSLAHTARLSHRASRGHSLDRVWTVGHFRPRPSGPVVRSVAARPIAGTPDLYRAAAGYRHALGGADSRDHGDSVHVVSGARGAQIGPARAT